MSRGLEDHADVRLPAKRPEMRAEMLGQQRVLLDSPAPGFGNEEEAHALHALDLEPRDCRRAATDLRREADGRPPQRLEGQDRGICEDHNPLAGRHMPVEQLPAASRQVGVLRGLGAGGCMAPAPR